MLVKATNQSAKLKVKIKELHRIVYEGEMFEVTPERYKVLSGQNRYRAVFVVEIKDVFERDDVTQIEDIYEPVEDKHDNFVLEEETIVEDNEKNVDLVENTVKKETKKTKKRGRKKKEVKAEE